MPKKNPTPTFIAFDLETTGFDPENDAIIEIGAIKFTYNQKGELVKLGELSQLVNPECELPIEVKLITGIHDNDLKKQPKFSEIVSDVSNFLADTDYLLGHNVGFDISFLTKHITLQTPAIDSQLFAEIFFPGLPSYSLDVLPFELKIERGQAHRAFDDALASAEVFVKSLRQFSALGNARQNIIDILSKSESIESNILSEALSILKPAKIFIPTTRKAKTTKPIKKLQKSFLEAALESGKKIFTHTASFGATESITSSVKQLSETTKFPILVSVKNKDDASSLKEANYLGDIQKLICAVRLESIKQRIRLVKPEATLAAKLIVAGHVDENFSWWPKITNEERGYLPEFIISPHGDCYKHKCKGWRKSSLKQNLKSINLTTHRNLWQLDPQELPPKMNILIVDFDEAVDTLMQNYEIRLSVDDLPATLSAIINISEANNKKSLQTKTNSQNELPLPHADNKLSSLIAELLNKNDLFWGILNIAYEQRFQSTNQIHLNSHSQQETEFAKIRISAQKIQKSLQDVGRALKNSNNPYLAAFASLIKQLSQNWLYFIEPSSKYHLYLEQYNGNVVIKLTPSFKYVSEIFKKYTSRPTLLTAATGTDGLTTHYTTLLDINDWPITRAEFKLAKKASLTVINSQHQPVDVALQILVQNPFQKTLVVAKNIKEIILYAEHLTQNLDSSYKVLYLDKTGSGANKALYNFAREDRAVLIAPPRGRILSFPWPSLDLAIVSSIPFPPPQPALGFTDWAMPQAMLAYKKLLNKILSSSSQHTRIYLIDGRLTNTDYGKNFTALASELCGCEPEYENI